MNKNEHVYIQESRKGCEADGNMGPGDPLKYRSVTSISRSSKNSRSLEFGEDAFSFTPLGGASSQSPLPTLTQLKDDSMVESFGINGQYIVRYFIYESG